MKAVYFIRHGQSEGNASIWRQQGSETVLTPLGLLQAKTVAQHMKKVSAQAIIASPFARTKATAAEISAELHLPVEYSELLVERRRPSVQITKRKLHPSWLLTQLQLMLFSRSSTYRHSDEETPDDLLKRAHAALALIKARSEERIIIVTHGRFMRALYAAMTIGEGVTGRAYLQATRRMRMKNTALMLAEHNENGWSVKAWNVEAQTL